MEAMVRRSEGFGNWVAKLTGSANVGVGVTVGVKVGVAVGEAVAVGVRVAVKVSVGVVVHNTCCAVAATVSMGSISSKELQAAVIKKNRKSNNHLIFFHLS
jgi:hypothetical protein